MAQELQLRARDSTELRCSLCHDVATPLATCALCATLFHEECRRSLERCPTLGCSGRLARSAETPRGARAESSFEADAALAGSFLSALIAGGVAIASAALFLIPISLLAIAFHVVVTPAWLARPSRPHEPWPRTVIRSTLATVLVFVATTIAVAVLASDGGGLGWIALLVGLGGWFFGPGLAAWLDHLCA